MSAKKPPGDKGLPKAEPPKVNIGTIAADNDELRIIVKLNNSNARAIYCIGDVRTIDYDPGSRKLEVRLTDAGRTLIPGIANMEPVIRTIDPGSDAELELRLHKTVVKLAPAGGSNPELQLQEWNLSEAEDIEVKIGWADIPHYHDTRDTESKEMPSTRWELGNISASKKMGKGETSS